MLSQDGGKQSLKPGQLNDEQQRNLVNFLLVLQHSRYLQMQRIWFPCLTRQSRKAPPRIERQILGMQHLDFTLVYSPGKNNPADFMSRNPSDTESSYLDKVTDELEESIIKMVKNKEKAGVSKNVKDVRKKDKMMIFLKERILQEDWKSTRRTL